MFNPDMETLPRDRLTRLQDERLRRLVHYVYERVPFYRQALDRAGVAPDDLRGVGDLPRLPFTRKSDLREGYPMGLFAVPQEQVARIHTSSGGTGGRPTFVGYTRNDLELLAEVNARCLAAAGARPGMVFHNAYGYGLPTGGLGLHYGSEKLGLTVVPVSEGMTERQLTLIQGLRPHLIACTPSYAQTLADAFFERGIDPDQISLRYGLLGAEPWNETIRADVEEGLGIQASNIYGLSEVIGPGVASEDVGERDGSYLWEDHFYPEIVDPDSGEPLPEGKEGVLVITTLTKEALPLLRYWTGDITALTREPGAGGRTHARMGQVRGRADDMVIIRGVNVYPSQVEAILQSIAEASSHYQLVLTRKRSLDQLELRLELNDEACRRIGQELLDDGVIKVDHHVQALRDRIRKRIEGALGVSVEVSLLAPGGAHRNAGGEPRRIVDQRRP